jgi:hypothetical protein
MSKKKAEYLIARFYLVIATQITVKDRSPHTFPGNADLTSGFRHAVKQLVRHKDS